MEFDLKDRENMSPQGQQPMFLFDNCLKPFEATTPSSSSKDFYLQDFHHLHHDPQIHVNVSSSSNPVLLYDSFDAFPYGCSANNVDFYECKPFDAEHGHEQVMDDLGSVGLLSLLQQRNSTNDVIMGSDMAAPFDFVVGGETAENGYYNKNRVLANPTYRRTSNWKVRKKSNGVKGQWTMEEDRLLIQLVEQYGVRKWSHIAHMLPRRIGKQCRERWHNHLRPHIKKDKWSEEEDKVLIQAHMEIGNKWAEIAKRLPGRTENSIKNHWNATKRRQFSKRKCRSKYPRGSILQEYIKSLNLESSSSSTRSQKKSSNATALDFCPSSTDRLVPEYEFNEFSFDEKLLQESCSIDSLLDQIPTAEQDMGPVKELDLVEIISAHPKI
ncbi:transcription factor MYB98-like [Hibiscus syriacus]|uniref:transcription factor MYB98-like n=1 Tax=Hibiscus syriacus TaxID=106335 RepID=UPI001920650E|nr:transcription factor MYB98-like [Hibiscus syriacus]